MHSIENSTCNLKRKIKTNKMLKLTFILSVQRQNDEGTKLTFFLFFTLIWLLCKKM